MFTQVLHVHPWIQEETSICSALSVFSTDKYYIKYVTNSTIDYILTMSIVTVPYIKYPKQRLECKVYTSEIETLKEYETLSTLEIDKDSPLYHYQFST